MTIDKLKSLRKKLEEIDRDIGWYWNELLLPDHHRLSEALAGLVSQLDTVVGQVNQEIGALTE